MDPGVVIQSDSRGGKMDRVNFEFGRIFLMRYLEYVRVSAEAVRPALGRRGRLPRAVLC